MAADRSYRIRGEARDSDAPPTSRVAVTRPRRLVLGGRRDAGADAVEAAAGDLARVTLGNGFSLWSRVDDLLHERGTRVQGRSGGEGLWGIDTSPPGTVRAGTRGWLGLGVKTLELFGVDLKGMTARELGKRLEERQLGQAPGLYACSLEDGFALTPLPGGGIPTDQGPCLLFIHGTGSSCEGSFGALWSAENKAGRAARGSFKARYGQRVYAWEHRSLTQSPIVNALELVDRLPQGVELDLITHSRGGLVGEVLCLAQRDRDPDPFRPDLIETLFAADRTVGEHSGLRPLDAQAAKARNAAYRADRSALAKLLALPAERHPRVRRFVRVACPARGTTLASGRLDRWLSVLTWLGAIAPVGEALDFLLAVVKERTDPRTLPGLEAMMPGSALTRLLNDPDLTTAADLSAITGDTEGDSIWGQLKLLVADWFYGSDHDLVVNTGSMAGGLRRRPGGARFQRAQGAEVNHFSYFKNDTSVRWLTAGLARVDGATGGFRPIETAPQEVPRWRDAVRLSRGSGRPRPLAVVLPGTMGTSLHADGREVWLDYWALMRGGLSQLRMDQGVRVEPADLLDAFYGPLLEFLAGSHRVEVFPYDWRLSVRDAARLLTERLEDWLLEVERSRQPVHLVAHSMGGLVVRAMIADRGRGAAVWRRIAALPESRLLMLGTPNQGSYEAMRWLTGCNPTLIKLTLLDLTRNADGIVDVVRDYPGLLELLPWGADGPDLSRVQFWRDLKRDLVASWAPARAAALRQASDTWTLLRRGLPDPQRVVYVAGCQEATVAGYALAPYEESHLAGRKCLSFLATAQGDGTVTWKSGALPGVPVWYVADTAHDALCTCKSAFPGYLDLLTSGRTARLSQTPPGLARGASVETGCFPLPARPLVDDIPDEAAVRRLAFGPGPPSADAEPEAAAPRIQVSIRHGNLAYARHPVLVGHYLGDTIVNAERALDERLGGTLGKRLQLGLYPGRQETHVLFLNERPGGKPAGALVIGLGQVGELSPGLIEKAVQQALLDYALRIAEWPDERFGDPKGVRSAALTCLPVGSGAGGVTVLDSVDAILRGAVAAASRLADAGANDRVVIDRIEFLELYEDIAIAAAEALEEVLKDGALADRVVWPGRVIDVGEGGLRRLRGDGPSDWWQRLEIIEEPKSGVLRFIASTDRARAEVTLATGQLRLADGFISQASRSAMANTEVSKTLYEMLLPIRLRELAQRQDDLVLLVDDFSARFPWELLEDRWSHSNRPPAVAAGLVRQLKTPEFRAHPSHATGLKALVVGNPDLNGWEDFADLPGARDEASRVAQLLRDNGFQVLDVVDGGADTILSGLHRDAWRILHLAGHGVHEFPLTTRVGAGGQASESTSAAREERASGMVIGKETLLTPGDVEQMRWVPDLVFVNCCHLGKTLSSYPPRYNWLAANLAVQFIRMGVRAVIAAGWAVDDRAGLAFAETFYARLLADEPFGAAVRAAREEVWTRYPDVNTWGAYQCYGEPSYRLRGQDMVTPRRAERRYHAPNELIADLCNQTEWIRMQMPDQGDDPQTLAALRQGIDALFLAIPQDRREAWLGRADVAAAVGFAWGETRAYAQAVTWLERALCANEGDCPLRALEQRNAFRVRLTGEQWQVLRGEPEGPGKEDRRQALVEQIDDSITELAAICLRAPTVERLTLLGNACRRLAWLQTNERGRIEALVNMAGYYGQAIERAGGSDPQRYPHWVAAKVLAAGLDPTRAGDWQEGVADECRRMIELAASRGAEQPSFRLAIAGADNETALLLTLGQGQEVGPGAEDRIVEQYRAAFRRGASPREVAAVLEGLDFLIALSKGLPAAVAAALTNIRQAL